MSYPGTAAITKCLDGTGAFQTIPDATTKSVGLSLPAEFSVSGSPVTTTGTLTAAWVPVANNLVLAGPSSAGPSTPAYRALAASDIPSLDAAKIASGTIDVARIPNLPASQITSGTIDTARLGSGTANSKSYLRGDQTWARGTYCVTVGTTNVHNPADATTYYVGQVGLAITTSADIRRVYLPSAGTIISAVVMTNSVTLTGTNESWAFKVRVNNGTGVAIGSGVAAATQYRTVVDNAMSVSVSAGDYIELECTSPTWATNPQGTYYWATFVVAA